MFMVVVVVVLICVCIFICHFLSHPTLWGKVRAVGDSVFKDWTLDQSQRQDATFAHPLDIMEEMESETTASVSPLRSWLVVTSGIATIATLAALAAFSSSVASADSRCTHDATAFRCVRYVKNYDADTITVDIPDTHPLIGKRISVRVRGLDTPEIKGTLPCEKEAARTAQRLVENLLRRAQRIDLTAVARDKYFRILADVKVDEQSLTEVLLKNHLAYAYDGGTKRKMDWCKRTPAEVR